MDKCETIEAGGQSYKHMVGGGRKRVEEEVEEVG